MNLHNQVFGERPGHGVFAKVLFPLVAASAIVYLGLFAHNVSTARDDIGVIGRVAVVSGIVPVKAIVYMAEEEILVGPMTLAEAKAEAKQYADADAIVFKEGTPEYKEALKRLEPSYQVAARWP